MPLSEEAAARAFRALLAAQFLAAMADNALLFVAIALLTARAAEDWQVPAMQQLFVTAFILTAPFVGLLADTLSRGRIMMWANTIKVGGVLLMLAGVSPLAGYALVGLGATLYAPAKYGILGSLYPGHRLVGANSWMEAVSIVAILLGVVGGGFLADYNTGQALWIIAGTYLAAAILNQRLPPFLSPHTFSRDLLGEALRRFGLAFFHLIRDPQARFSIFSTSVFWGAGTTLRLMLVVWVPVALGTASTGTVANLNGLTAVGIALGAVLAARFITLRTLHRSLAAGVLIGAGILWFAWQDTFQAAGLLLVLAGICGGLYVIPLNALLQNRGHQTVGAGQAIAVQNLIENLTVLLMLGAYGLLLDGGLDIRVIATAIGGFVLATVILLGWGWYRHTRPGGPPSP